MDSARADVLTIQRQVSEAELIIAVCQFANRKDIYTDIARVLAVINPT